MNKIARFSLIGCLSVLLLIGAFAGGLFVGHLSSSGSFNLPFVNMPAVPGIGAPSGGATPEEYQTLFAPFWEAWQLVHDQYVDQPVDDTKLMQGAIRGMLEALGDEHTSYMDPQQFKDANAEPDQTIALAPATAERHLIVSRKGIEGTDFQSIRGFLFDSIFSSLP